jgi:hypothetical protein
MLVYNFRGNSIICWYIPSLIHKTRDIVGINPLYSIWEMEGRDYVICSICPILKREWDKGKDYIKWRWEGKDSYLLFFSIRAKGMERFLFALFFN